MEKTSEGWDRDVWERMQNKLATLTLNELRTIAKRGGINFVKGGRRKATKQDYILILDELGEPLLRKEVDKLKKLRRNKKGE